MSELRLVVEFLNDSPDFAYGFEAGKVYQQMRDAIPVIEGTYHTQNLEQMMLMARKLGYSALHVSHLEGDWVQLRFQRSL